jgi:hypothetical protein
MRAAVQAADDGGALGIHQLLQIERSLVASTDAGAQP